MLDIQAQETDVRQKSDTAFRNQYQLHIKQAGGSIKLDGILDEEAWQRAEAATDFWLKYPRDDEKGAKKTTVRMTYDNRYLYVGAVCYDTSTYVIQTLKRDSRFWSSDGFAIVLDPVNQRTNGFFFGVSPYNVQAEDLITPSTFGSLNFSWDNRWYSETQRYPDRWTVEIAIPFKTLRFEAGKTAWGVNFVRNDLKTFQYHTWTNVPVNFEAYDLGYTGQLLWDKAPDRARGNVALIPYATGSVIQDNEQAHTDTKGKLNAGLDAKVAVTSSLNLDLTVNPDFSQVEVDQQQTNLTRFNLFFPERRTFFLENADIFNDFGTPPARPFFSRRIGLDESGQPIPILFGARLSGNVNKNLRIGVMNMQTKAKDNYRAQNYSTVAFHQRVLSRSLIKGYATNRQAFAKGEGFKKDDFGRNAGLELNYVNPKGTINTWAGYHLSGKPGITQDNSYANLAFGYSGRNFSAFIDYFHMGTNYYADMGFINRIENYDAEKDTVIRLGFKHIYTETRYSIRPKTGKGIVAHNFSQSTVLDYNPDGSFNERLSTLGYGILFRNTAGFSVNARDQDIRLLFPTRFTTGLPLPKGTYKFQRFSFRYNSDARRKLAAELEASTGEFYNGVLQSYSAALTYRTQPWGNFTLRIEQNELQFPDPYGQASLTLIGQRTEINFSNSLFWTTFLQYNTQRNNFNVNSRLQWRYRPMSDVYVVYTDNYFTDPFLKNKNRAVVLKVSYWL